MRVHQKPFRIPSELQTSLVDNIPLMQLGKVVGPTNDAVLYIPCDIENPQFVALCPLDATSEDLITTGIHWNSLTPDTAATLIADATFDWATSTAYVVGQIVSDGSDYIYVCLESHTSGTFADDLASGYWKQINPKAGFLKGTITAQAAKAVTASYQIIGY